jgi:small subunit ribosomal protein S6
VEEGRILVQEEFMIYELCLVTRPSEEDLTSITTMVHGLVKEYEGEVLIEDDWGVVKLAQRARAGVETGHFLYFILDTNPTMFKELTRRININESIIKDMTVKLGKSEDGESIVKKYKTPYSKRYNGSNVEEGEDARDIERARKKFAKKRSCWFTAKGITADWKDPKTYSWLVNEFGKIAPARVTGISRKHQRFSESTIKRARQMGLASYVTGRISF